MREEVGDLVDHDLLAKLLAEREIDSVFHLAAETIVGTVQADPLGGLDSNVRGTWMLLHAAQLAGVERFVFASSDKAYGAHEKLPYSEDFALQPTAPYEASKSAADLIARMWWPSYGLPVAVTRFANIYGGGDLNFSRLVPEAICASLDGRAPVLRSDGSPVRDLLYVEDAAAAYLAIADNMRPRRGPRRGLQRRRRAPLHGARDRRGDHPHRRHGSRARDPGDGQPRGRDRPPVRRCLEDPAALPLVATGLARAGPGAGDHLVSGASRGPSLTAL